MKKFLLGFLNICFIATCICYFVSCLTPYIHPKYFFVLSFLSIGYTVLLIVMLWWLVFYLFINRKKSLITTIIILLGFKNISNNIGFGQTTNIKTNNSKISILSWNVRGFEIVNDRGNFEFNKNYIEYIKTQNADVICLQDVENNPNVLNVIDTILKQCKYPFFYFAKDLDTFIARKNLHEQYGTCVLSKFPIINTHQYNYPGKYFTESIASADILVKNKKIRIYNTHLKSMYIKINRLKFKPDFNYPIEDSNLVFNSNVFDKIKTYDLQHIEQAYMIKSIMDTTTVPFVFCADINSTPSSYVYNILSKNTNDAYLKHNTGWTKSYTSYIPGMRIDLVLLSKNILSIYHKKQDYRLSDHYPSITNIVIP